MSSSEITAAWRARLRVLRTGEPPPSSPVAPGDDAERSMRKFPASLSDDGEAAPAKYESLGESESLAEDIHRQVWGERRWRAASGR